MGVNTLADVSRALTKAVKTNGDGGKRTRFHNKAAPAITIAQYFERISGFCEASDEVYVIACVLMDRLASRQAPLKLDRFNTYRILVVCVLIAAKLHDDTYYSNEYYAKIAGLSLTALDELEQTVLLALSFDLYVSREEYEHYLDSLSRGTASDDGFIVPAEPAPCTSFFESSTISHRSSMNELDYHSSNEGSEHNHTDDESNSPSHCGSSIKKSAPLPAYRRVAPSAPYYHC
ncbi:hypothetical protein DIPPA_15014 [Diplonema papillatum]|nr:Cyclin-U4-1 [Diplonema papillatum]KAJ9458841.1 hypothetical protein DIPPA_15014 [Diplonema papillatum]